MGTLKFGITLQKHEYNVPGRLRYVSSVVAGLKNDCKGFTSGPLEAFGWFTQQAALCMAGYPTIRGQVLNGEQLWDVIEGLEANGLLYYTHLLTGEFFKSPPRLSSILEARSCKFSKSLPHLATG